jgi:hypothetical protein
VPELAHLDAALTFLPADNRSTLIGLRLADRHRAALTRTTPPDAVTEVILTALKTVS